ALVQSRLPRSDYTAGRQAGRRAPQSPDLARRQLSRHGRVQHHRERVAGGEAASHVPAGKVDFSMLIDFFLHLKAAKLPVSTREFLTLLDALEHNVVSNSIDDFYFLARTCLVKDEALYDRFNLAFGAYSQDGEGVFDIRAEIPEEWIRKAIEGTLTEEEKALVKALFAKLGGWDKLMETLKQRLAEQRA